MNLILTIIGVYKTMWLITIDANIKTRRKNYLWSDNFFIFPTSTNFSQINLFRVPEYKNILTY